MRGKTDHTRAKAARAIARKQHGVISRAQLLRLGFTSKAIEHRVNTGRLIPVFRGVYAVGRRELGPEGSWMAAILACDEEEAAISHESAVALYGIGRNKLLRPVHISLPAVGRRQEREGIVVHRRKAPFEVTTRRGIRVTTPECTIIDMAASWSRDDTEGLLNEAVIRRLTTVKKVRRQIDLVGRRPGAKALRRIIDIRTFRFTRSKLERAFIPIALRAGLPRPLTAQVVNGYEVDFYWPELGLIVETDGLAFHRTPAQQAEDLKRDQAHMAAGLTCCRFSHGQIRYEANRVEQVLGEVRRRLGAREDPPQVAVHVRR
jgi:very-short-patch-repair endonuclease